jgi:pathogenesis-related protein 1
MVWKETTHVGMGIAICKNGGMIIVANYNPAGNYIGEKPY